MNCETVLRSLVAFHEGELERRQAEAVGTHLRACPRCAESREELVALDRWIAADENPPVSAEFVRTTVAAMTAARRPAVRRSWPVTGAVLALAAMMLTAFMILFRTPPSVAPSERALASLGREVLASGAGRLLSSAAVADLNLPVASTDTAGRIAASLRD